MEIKELTIEGFKSIGSITLSQPNPFSVFVGPNAAGKSNIFEALEFWALCNFTHPNEVLKYYGNIQDIFTSNKRFRKDAILFLVDLGRIKPTLRLLIKDKNQEPPIKHSTYNHFGRKFYDVMKDAGKDLPEDNLYINSLEYKEWSNFSRVFVGKSVSNKRNIQDDTILALDASNLEKVLKRILKDKHNKEEIEEVLQLLIPGFDKIEIVTEELSGSDNLVVYEHSLQKPLTKRLISDGTYNIIALIAAIYQSDEPQFLCIEEPENGLNPKVVKELVHLFRRKCEEKGHYIWLNTHSQTLVSELSPEEIILVDKVGGLTQVKQIKGFDLHGLKMDEALLSNALGGGIPW